MRYGSVCSGVEAASLAWEPLGWQPQWFAEVEKFPSAVLAHHWPTIPNLGDITDDNFIEQARRRPIDVLVGGTPCQSFSVAGLRRGMDDDRGNLSLQFCRIADALQPGWVVWENVPGVLSSGNGRDFGSIVGALVEIGYDIAWRILDAQYFGVPQRRRRVFLVGHLGQRRGAAAVLFERESIAGHIAPRRKTGQGVTPLLEIGARTGSAKSGAGIGDPGDMMYTLQAGKQHGVADNSTSWDYQRLRIHDEKGIAPTLSQSDGSGGQRTPTIAGTVSAKWAKGTGGPSGDEVQNLVVNARENPIYSNDQSLPLGAQDTGHAVAIAENQQGELRTSDTVTSLNSGGGKPGQGYAAIAFLPGQGVAAGTLGIATEQAPTLRSGCDKYGVVKPPQAVRRLTPVECERLQGMPDNHTRIPWRNKPAEDCPDGPRYKAIGNSMAVPVMRWIGERIIKVENVLNEMQGAASHRSDGVH
jgi:DNA (cytosine-5)-methyltransferase 1